MPIAGSGGLVVAAPSAGEVAKVQEEAEVEKVEEDEKVEEAEKVEEEFAEVLNISQQEADMQSNADLKEATKKMRFPIP